MWSQRTYRFLVVLLLILPLKKFSQQQMPRIGQNSPYILNLPKNLQVDLETKMYSYTFNNNIPDKFPIVTNHYSLSFHSIEIVQPEFYTSHLPFFCKEEFQFEKTTSIPLRIRLGSLDYVNKMEGKN